MSSLQSSLKKFGPRVSALALVVSASTIARADDAQPNDATRTAPAVTSVPPTMPHPHAYGILVGTNQGGPGQATLRYAEDDARQVAQVFRELGRFGTANMRVLAHPDADEVLRAVDEVGRKIAEDAAKNRAGRARLLLLRPRQSECIQPRKRELPISVLRENWQSYLLP